MWSDPLLQVTAFIVAALGIGRAARLLTHDTFPPVLAARLWWVNHAPGGWADLATCPFCMAPWLAAADLTWALLADVTGEGFWTAAWWVVNLWAAVAYAAAIIVAHDEPE